MQLVSLSRPCPGAAEKLTWKRQMGTLRGFSRTSILALQLGFFLLFSRGLLCHAQEWPEEDLWAAPIPERHPSHLHHSHHHHHHHHGQGTAVPRHASDMLLAQEEANCACRGKFKHHDYVQVTHNDFDSTKGLKRGHRGHVVAASRGPPDALAIMVEFDDWHEGHGGECAYADCHAFPDCQEHGSSRWWVLCDDVQLVAVEQKHHDDAIAGLPDPLPTDISDDNPCAWSEWEEWPTCSVTCGGGVVQRSRTRRNAEATCDGGSRQIEERTCGLGECPVDCSWGLWTEWPEGQCTTTCGGGVQERHRVVTNAGTGGKPCEGNATENRPCNDQPCPVDCSYGDWHDWPSTCSASCGGGTQMRVRDMYREMYGGAACEGTDQEGRSCNTQDCPVDCTWGPWSDWEASCSVTCGGGIKTRQRPILAYAEHGGAACHGGSQEAMDCNSFPCPTDCAWSDWSEWDLHGACTKTCGGGVQVREREILHEATYGGKPCLYPGDASEERECMVQPCPAFTQKHAECQWAPWGEWSACSSSCGGGMRSRHRGIMSHLVEDIWKCIAENGNDTDTALCNMEACPIKDCEWSQWTEWSHCSASCAGGQQERSRHHIQEADEKGDPCKGLGNETRLCNNFDCAGCEYTDWTDWDSCTVSCGGGLTRRLRYPQHPEAHLATEMCHTAAEDVHSCNSQPCFPKVCAYAHWSEWSDCSATCGAGRRERQRRAHFVADDNESAAALAELEVKCQQEHEYDQCAMATSCPSIFGMDSAEDSHSNSSESNPKSRAALATEASCALVLALAICSLASVWS